MLAIKQILGIHYYYASPEYISEISTECFISGFFSDLLISQREPWLENIGWVNTALS